MQNLYRDNPRLILAIIVANVILSFWSVSLDSVINNDGITYLAMAELYLKGDWTTANSYYSWPFYPLLIAAVAKITSFEVTLAAHVLNTLLATSTTLAFVSIVHTLSNNHVRTVLIAAVVILLFPSITKYRAYIIRDFGYISFYLWSLYFIFRFCTSLDKRHLIGWLSTTALGCLFRFEGIILMLVAPYFLLVFSNKKIPHRRTILASMSVGIVLISVLIISWYLQDKYAAKVQIAQGAGRDIEGVLDLFMHNIRTQFDPHSSSIFSYLSLVIDNSARVLYDLVRRMAVVYFIIGLYAYLKGFALSTPLIRRVWQVYLITNLLMLIGFSLANNLMVSRYTLATSLTLLLLAPFALNHLWEKRHNYQPFQRNLVYGLFVLITLVSVKNLDVSTKKTHLAEAGGWLHQHLTTDHKLFSNDRIIVHYAQLGPKSNFIDQFTNAKMRSHMKNGLLDHYHFVALSVTNKNKDEIRLRERLIEYYGNPIKTFSGVEGRSVSIFTTQAHQRDPLAVKYRP